MVIGLVVGVVVSLFQALTQIQEQTLIFVPKILAIFVTLLLALPFMADSLHGHMMRISSRIIGGWSRVDEFPPAYRRRPAEPPPSCSCLPPRAPVRCCCRGLARATLPCRVNLRARPC